MLLGDRLTLCRCKIGALIKPLDESFRWILCVVWQTEALVVRRNIYYGDEGVFGL